MNLTLRIKRKYFDEILFKNKRIEYRDVKEYYDKIFKQKDDIKTLTLHYQGQRVMQCQVTAIKKITLSAAKKLTPHEFTSGDVSFSSHVYAIFIRAPKLIRK